MFLFEVGTFRYGLNNASAQGHVCSVRAWFPAHGLTRVELFGSVVRKKDVGR